jgi:small subunit ribosomal protein S7
MNPSFIFSEKFINFLIIDGKKVKAYKLFFLMLESLQKKTRKQAEVLTAPEIMEQAIRNCMPSLEVRKVRVAGTTYLVPAMIPKKKQETLAIRWIIEAAKKKKNTSKLSFAECLAEEVYDAFSKQGYARTKRNELHRLAEANRAYIRYRWW